MKIIKQINSLEKKKFINIIKNNANKDCITHGNKIINYKNLLSYICQINSHLNKNNFNNEIIIIQFKNKFCTLVFYIAAIFSKTTICPLDPKLPLERVLKIKKSIGAKKILKKFSLNKNYLVDLKKLNLNNHNFLLTFSSGTSGDPKGIAHSSNNILGISKSYGKHAKYNKKTRLIHCLPEYYMAGIINTFFACIYNLGHVFVEENFGKKSIFNFWSNIFKKKINLVYLVPSIYSMISIFSPLIAKQLIKKNKIEFYSTSNNLYPNVRKTFFKKFNKKIKSCYGITEMGGPLSNETKPNNSIDSVGKLINGCKLKFKKINEKKILFFKSKFSALYFLVNGKKVSVPLDKDGFFNSQDTGLLKNKNIVLTGREKDILKKGGEYIYLKDVENEFIKLPFVENVAAVGIKNDLSDEKLYLYIKFFNKSLNKKNINFLISFIRKRTYRTEKPDKIIILKNIPKTISGKIIKRELLKIHAKNKIKEIIL